MSKPTNLSGIYAEHAERTILGAILLENTAFYEAAQDLRGDELSLDSHRRIYACVSRLISRGSAADTTTVLEELRASGELDSVGGHGYIMELTEGVPRNFSISSYVRQVKEKATLREIGQLGESLGAAITEPGQTAEDVLDCAEAHLLDIRAGRDPSLSKAVAADMSPLITRMWAEKNRSGDLLGLPSGIPPLDLVTRGYQPGEITIVGAKSGVGKTSLLIQSTVANVSQETPVLLFSLEMTREQILRRVLSAVTDIPFPRVRDPKFASDVDMQRLTQAAAKIEKWPLHIVDTAGITIEKIGSSCGS